MFNERVTQILDSLNASNQEISRCADCTPSNISRLKSGARKPDPLSPTIDKLINGVIHYATLHEKMDSLLALIGDRDDDSEILETRIRRWLYQDEPIPANTSSDTKDSSQYSVFGKKFSQAVALSELTNSQISHQLNVDPSLISRFLSGTRTPKSNPDMYDRLCNILYTQIMALNKQHELIKLMQLADINLPDNKPEYTDQLLYQHFHAWLYDFKNEDHIAIHHLLSTIETFTVPQLSEIQAPDISVTESLMKDTTSSYREVSGLQKATLRFLSSVIAHKAKELLLYSDQDIKWMLKDEKFNRDWASLMAVCVSNGIKIKIIHNIERNLSEMTEAIEAWLPLYMAGTIEPYYCNKQNGNRFSHTMFICPDVAAITACLVKGTEDKGLYRYCTDEDELDYHINSFNALLTDCEPLAHIKPGITADRTLLSNNNATQKIDLHNIRLEVNSNYVNVIKENAPSITFTFLHPFMCEAFESYIQTIHPES